MTSPLYQRMTVIGFGLIGGSIVRAARELGLVGEIVVAEVDPAFRARVEALGLADSLTGDVVKAATGADLVVIASPPATIPEVARLVGPALKPGATLTDVGSVKSPVSDAMASAVGAGVFVIPGHPIAGTEHSGPDSGFAELFRDRWTILCPRPSDAPGYDEALKRLTAFWEAMGARVETMDQRHHDMVLAITSHLPHLIAYTIVGTAAHLEAVSEGEVMKFSASGFRDFTRIAASDPVMWRDIFLQNRAAVLDMLGRFQSDLAVLSDAIEAGDGSVLQDHFSRTRAIRRGIVALGQDSAKPNFGRDKG